MSFLPGSGIWNRSLFGDYKRSRDKLISNIFDAQERLGWSNAELGRRAKVNPNTIGNIYYGHTSVPTSGTLFKLCKALNIPCTL